MELGRVGKANSRTARRRVGDGLGDTQTRLYPIQLKFNQVSYVYYNFD